ncbi:Actin cytoplasmic, partial [Clarias magur]
VKACPSLPSERVLCSGAVTFPGVFDQLGSALLIFPAESQHKLLCDVTKEEVAEFVFYCLRLHNKGRSECLVSVLADLRDASLAVTRRLAEILLLLQLHRRTVHTFYAVQPKKRDVQKLLQKLLTPSKRSPPQVKCVFLREVFELSNYVDRSQLTSDLGGYSIYSHESWVSFIKEMDGFVQEFVSVVRKLPACIGALQDVSNLPVPHEYEPLSVFCSTNQARLERLRRDLGLDALLTSCECVLEKFRFPERDPCYQAMVGTALFTHTALEMLQNYDRIRAAVDKVELLWTRVFSRAHQRLHVLQLQRDAQQVVCEMECVVQKMQSYTPETLRDPNSAETARLEFNTSVHTRATALVRRAEDLLKSETMVSTESRGINGWITELQRQMDLLRAAMDLQNRNLNTVCTFHHRYHKIRRWYHVAVRESFLQDLLWRTCSRKHDNQDTLLSPAQNDVLSEIEEFLRMHPPPEVDELMQLVHLANIVAHSDLQNAGKQLVQRCTSLRKLLVSPGSATFRDLQPALQWQYEYLKGKNEAVDSTPDVRTPRNVCSRSILGDSDFFPHSINGNGLTRPDGADYPPLLQSGAKPPSLSSFDSGFDGTGSGHLETGGGRTCQGEASSHPKPGHLCVVEENASSISEGLVEEKSIRAPSIHIVPSANRDSLNFEITVKRSATLPKNPWLSLPVDDLENCYTVIISPSNQKLTKSCDQLTQTADTSVCDVQDQSTEWSPIRNVLSSTLTDKVCGAETSETVPTLLWDSYDLRDVMGDSDTMSLGEPKSEWEMKEHEELRAVEETLSRAAGILREEENVLAQEEILDVLLEADDPNRLWPSWSKDCKFTPMTSSDLAEAGVIGLEDDLASLHFEPEAAVSQESQRVIQCGSDGPSEPSSEPLLCLELGYRGPDGSRLLKEMEQLKVLEERIVEENLKIKELRYCGPEERMSPQCLDEDRKTFLGKLDQEKKEVEEMERNLSMEMKKSKLKRPGRSHKIVTCSILGKSPAFRKDDEALLMNCRRSGRDVHMFSHEHTSLEEPTNPQNSDMSADNYIHHKCSDPGRSINSKLSLVSDQQNIDTTASFMSTVPSVIVHGDIETNKLPDLVSSASDLLDAHVSAVGEPRNLSDHFDMREEKCLCLDLSENVDTTEPCNEDPIVKSLASDEVSSPAFDPGGPTPLPRTSRLNKQMSANSEENASYDVSQTVFTSLASSVGLKSKDPQSRESAIDLHHHNTNNNNLHTVAFHSVGSENVPELGRFENPAAWSDKKIFRSQSPPLETSNPCLPVETHEPDVQVRDAESSLTRRFCRSPVQHQPQIYTTEMSDFQTPVVLDTGSSLVKAGFADQDLPTTIFPTAVGLPKYEEVMSGSVERGVYVGHNAQHMRGVLTLHYPMRNGVVSNWDHMEMIWSHAFEQLRVCSEDHPVLLTEGAMSAHENRQRSVQLMFECFNVPLAYTAMQPVLALYATGRTTGVVFDSGDSVSHSVPVFDGYCLPHAVQRFNLAGADVTLHLKQLLTEQGVCMRTSAEMEIVREIKERCCCVALNYEAELGGGGVASARAHYSLPDGHVVSLTTERFRAPEILFRPELVGQDHYGMHESIFKSVLQSDIDLRRSLVGNIVLS